jgi:hypothetical protein
MERNFALVIQWLFSLFSLMSHTKGTCGHVRPKSPNFSSMNSMVTGEFFSKASTTIRQHQHHHLLWLSNTVVLAYMVVLQPHPQQWPGNDIKLAHLLMHKFIPMPFVGQNNGILLAYELEDVSLHDHLF